MATNLDALIPREDFEITITKINSSSPPAWIQVRDLEDGAFLYPTLRKPDFQRETSEWKDDKIYQLLNSFISGDLIPAIILWNSWWYNFVIDWAHRLSAIIAWVNDDYGDWNLSKSFFWYIISQEQLDAAEKTRKLVNKEIWSYNDHKFAISNPNKANPRLLENAQRLANLTITLQWVRWDSTTAEASFFKINEQASPINETEKKLLKSRKKPNAIAARAIIRSGTWHKYWSKFEKSKQDDIEKLSKEINDILFTPRLQTPIKTLDIPLAWKGYATQTLALILDLVNITNDISTDTLSDDTTWDETIKILKTTKSTLEMIAWVHPKSLWLHPAVYFYSITWRYQVTAFLAIIEFFKSLEQKWKLWDFIKKRRLFEDFIIKHKSIINQINTKYWSWLKSYKHLKKLYDLVLQELITGLMPDEVILRVKQDFPFINTEIVDIENQEKSEFSSSTKSAIFLTEALANPLRCKICDWLIHKNSISIDHKDRIEDWWKWIIENWQLTHPYCNSTIKN